MGICRSETGGTVIRQDYTCQMCGAVYFLRFNFERHRNAEIPAFVQLSARKREIAEEKVVAWREANGLRNYGFER